MIDESSTKKTKPIDWQQVDTVLLDMDGTLLDLAYDNHFWTEHLPARYAQLREISVEASDAYLAPIFESTYGSLDWYCIDYWSRRLEVDIESLKRETADRVTWLNGAQTFLKALQQHGIPGWLVTNAHPRVLRLKIERTGLDSHLDSCFSSHDFGYAKEDADFWPVFAAHTGVKLARCLFIDDNLRVLETASQCGVGQCVAISRPDSRHPARELEVPWPVVPELTALLTGLN